MRVLSATSSGPFVHDPVPVLAGVKVLAPPGRFTLTRLRPANPAATEASQTPPRSRASPPAPLDKTRPHGCKDSTGQHAVDDPRLSCNSRLGVRVPPSAPISAGQRPAIHLSPGPAGFSRAASPGESGYAHAGRPASDRTQRSLDGRRTSAPGTCVCSAPPVRSRADGPLPPPRPGPVCPVRTRAGRRVPQSSSM